MIRQTDFRTDYRTDFRRDTTAAVGTEMQQGCMRWLGWAVHALQHQDGSDGDTPNTPTCIQDHGAVYFKPVKLGNTPALEQEARILLLTGLIIQEAVLNRTPRG